MSDQSPPDPQEEKHRDQMAPPEEPCECWCMHCGRTFMSNLMWFQKMIGDPSGFDGFWMCPTPNCGGAGFTFDIFPTDPDHPANDGWHYSDDDEEEGEQGEWDPDESKYTEMDEDYAEDDDDLEGEEWKHGLQPGERPGFDTAAFEASQAEARREREEEERKYDEPDTRPREVYWTEPPKRPPGTWSDDEIPF